MYTLYSHVCLPTLSLGLCSSVFFLCDHTVHLFLFLRFRSLCIINYFRLVFVCVLQRNRFLAYPWVLWSLFELLYTLGATIFLIAVWHGVSFILNCYSLLVNF